MIESEHDNLTPDEGTGMPGANERDPRFVVQTLCTFPPKAAPNDA